MRNDIAEAIVEIPFRSRNKYEINRKTGKVILDRVLHSAMGYPAEYGYIEDTLAPDGDPLDILILITETTYPGCIIPARIVGYLEMTDHGYKDYKLIAVVNSDPRFNHINNLEDIPEFTLTEIKNFFENYKKLENIEVIVKDYHNKEEAIKLLESCKRAYIENNK